MKSFLRILFYVSLNVGYFLLMGWIIYAVWKHKIPFFWIFLVFALFFRLPSVLTAYSRYSMGDDDYTLNLAIKTHIPSPVTPEFILDILHRQNVIHAIQNDLRKTRQIGYKEEWRLGLITPDQDVYDPGLMELPAKQKGKVILEGGPANHQISLKRTAVLNSTDYFKSNNIAIRNGLVKPMGYSKWTYGLETKLNRGEFIDLRQIRMEDNSSISEHRARLLPGFLREEGFPIREVYLDGDPLTTDRGGIIVVHKDDLIVIYPRYFVQRRLVDDEGNLIDLGMDENLNHNTAFDVQMWPSVSRLLIRRVHAKRYIPVIRYRSFPYASDFMLPILDTPMSASGWADLLIDTRGKAKLFISKNKTEAEWYEMMNRLKVLFQDEIIRNDCHLLRLTKDRARLHDYLMRKMDILKDYYIIQDWNLV